MIAGNGRRSGVPQQTTGVQVVPSLAAAIAAVELSCRPSGPRPLRPAIPLLRVSRNAQVFGEGDAADFLYTVSEGAVRLCKLLADGRRQIYAFALPGDCFGWTNLDSYAFAAEAIADSSLLRYPWRRLRQLGEWHPELRRRLLSLTMENLVATQLDLVRLGRMTVEERLSSFLLEMVSRGSHRPFDGDHVDLPMGRQDIADYLGMTLETVSRIFGRLKRNHIIALTHPNRIVLQDIAALRHIAGGNHAAGRAALPAIENAGTRLL